MDEPFEFPVSSRWIMAGERNAADFILKSLLPPDPGFAFPTTVTTEEEIRVRFGRKAHFVKQDDKNIIYTPFLPFEVELIFPVNMECFDFGGDMIYDDEYMINGRFCICDGPPFQEQSIRDMAEEEQKNGWSVLMILYNPPMAVAATDIESPEVSLKRAKKSLQERKIPFLCIQNPNDVSTLFSKHPGGTEHFFGLSYWHQQIHQGLQTMEKQVQKDEKDEKHSFLENMDLLKGFWGVDVRRWITEFDTVKNQSDSYLWDRYKSAGRDYMNRPSKGFDMLIQCFKDRMKPFVITNKEERVNAFRIELLDRYNRYMQIPDVYSGYMGYWAHLHIGNDMAYKNIIGNRQHKLYGIDDNFFRLYRSFWEKECYQVLFDRIHAIHDELEKKERSSRI